jgi:hypothetical protein
MGNARQRFFADADFHAPRVKLPEYLRDLSSGRQKRLGHVDAKTTLAYTPLVSADDVRVAEQLGALLGKEFLTRDLPKSTPNAGTASERISEAV